MYLQFYGLRELPFELTSNPRFLFLTNRHREALSNLQYAMTSGRPLTVLLGEAGTGKTTLLRSALESDACRHVRSVCLTNPILAPEEFIRTLAGRFGLSARAAESKTLFLDELECLLRERRAQGQLTVLVVDEAQSLGNALLEEIRLLANIETSTAKLLLLVLAGQPELAERLNDPTLRQLKQRVGLRAAVGPFDLAETAAYIDSRIGIAGGESMRLFTREAVQAVHEHARGIPRTINVICDNALLSGFALGRQPVDSQVVLDVVADFDLTPPQAVAAGGGASSAPGPGPEPVDACAPVPTAATPARPMFAQFTRSRRRLFWTAAGDARTAHESNS